MTLRRSLTLVVALTGVLCRAAAAQEPVALPEPTPTDAGTVLSFGAGAGWAFPVSDPFGFMESGPSLTSYFGVRPADGTIGGELQVGYRRFGIEDADDAHVEMLVVSIALTKAVGRTVLLVGATYAAAREDIDGGSSAAESAFGAMIGVRRRLSDGRVPVLAELPVLGHLFRRGGEGRDLLMHVTPHILVQGETEP
jgi:hypothetical protein